MTGFLGRLVIVTMVAVGVGGCGLMNSDLFTESFWASSPLHQNEEAELGVAQLAKGNYVTAEAHFKRALKSNPRDIDALIGSGILYQNTGQMVKAREMYEAVLALRPDDSHQFVVWSSIATRPASEIASVNLSLLESGGVPSAANAAAAAAARAAPGQPAPPAMPAQPVTGAPTSTAMLGRAGPMSGGDGAAVIGKLGAGDGNVVSRFATMRALRDQGLITQAEYEARRRANLGALLPLTTPPPAAGLDRPVPTSEQISGRLRAIGRALEMRAISVSQHANERGMILDALMPSAPVVVANPAVPPNGLLAAADSVRRLEQLRDSGYISSDEYSRERQAIELSMRPQAPAPRAAAPAPTTKAEPMKMEKKMAGPAPAVHLASYKSQKQAARGWTQIRRAHNSLIGGMSHEISRVNLGKKGTYYRLKVGPLDSSAAASSLCKKLKRRRQFCEPSMMGKG